MMPPDVYGAYLDSLLAGRRSACADMVQRLLDEGIGVKQLYVQLFQESMYEVGRLWETGKISVATEHLATSITEFLMALVYPAIFSAEHIGKTALVSCTANELHQIGGKMVADILELHGWHGYFLGANTPVAALLDLVGEKNPDMLALSLSVSFNMSSLLKVLELVRESYPRLPVILGGQAFRWGGREIEERYQGVRILASLHDLECYISGMEQ